MPTTLASVSAQPPESPGIRISDADRERAASRLHQAMAEGRITIPELEERLSAVYAARFEADLRPPLADLPGGEVAVVPHTPLAVPADGAQVVLRAGMSTIKRKGEWEVPPRLRVVSAMGSVLLDFCETPIPPVIDIEVELGAGSARLLVPDGSTANVDGVSAGMGTVRSKVPSVRRPGAPHFVVHGKAGMGSLTIRRRYRFAGFYF